MKKRLSFAIVLLMPLVLSAQDNYHFSEGNSFSRQLFEIPATLLGAYIFVYFIISIVRLILDNRLKFKMIEKGVSDKVVEQILQPTRTDALGQALKWFLVLAGIGVGLGIVSATRPFGIHSIGIIAFCLALSFLGYFLYMKRSENK
jgi:hypothetical protein